jgi:hypothetical protein
MEIVIVNEKKNTQLSSWDVYSNETYKLIIPRIGESMQIEYQDYTVLNVKYCVQYMNFGSPYQIRIYVKKQHENIKYE